MVSTIFFQLANLFYRYLNFSRHLHNSTVCHVILMLKLLRKVNLWSKDQTIINGHSLELLQALNGFDLKWLCSLLPEKGRNEKWCAKENYSRKVSKYLEKVKYTKEIWTMIGPIRKKVLFKCQFYHCNKNLQISKPNKEIPIHSQRGQNIFSVLMLFFHILNISNTEC